MIRGRNDSKRYIASRKNTITSVAANSTLSDKNSMRTGITVAAISGNYKVKN